jgi:hypothetical protein
MAAARPSRRAPCPAATQEHGQQREACAPRCADTGRQRPRLCAATLPPSPPQAPQAGEIVNFVAKDGSPVEYKQVVVEMAPYFGEPPSCLPP